MEDPTCFDGCALNINHWDDGRISATFHCDVFDGRQPMHIYRSYRPGTDLGEVIDDMARMLSGWGAWGQLGVAEAAASLRQVS